MIEILINQLDEHNEGNILATLEFKPREVYYIMSNDEMEKMDSVRLYYQKNFKNVKIREFIVDEGNRSSLEYIVSNLNKKNTIINLTGGKRINSLILLNLSIQNKITSIYMDIKNKISYKFKDGVSLIHKSFGDLDVNDIVKAAGGEIVEDSSDLCDKEDLIYLSRQIGNNISLWHKYKQRLYDTELFNHDTNKTQYVYINLDKANDVENKLLMKILNKLKEMNEITIEKEKNILKVEFLNYYIKGFLFKSGTWLEIVTKMAINKIEEVDEAKNGVMFLWSNKSTSLRNEVDVLAVKDSVPIFISCKDSDKYNEMALNELNVYANQIGGENSYKILVATKEPIKEVVKTRAKEMGIHIVIFDGDEGRFIKKLKYILKSN